MNPDYPNMSFQFLSFEPDADGLALVTINRPEKLNALNQAVISALSDLGSWHKIELPEGMSCQVVFQLGFAANHN